MVDSVQLRLVDVLVELGGQSAGRLEVVPERLLDHDPRAARETCVGELLHDLAEQERRDLEVEDGRGRAVDRRADPLVRGWVGEVARDIRQAIRETVEYLLVELLAGSFDRRAGAFLQVVNRPVVY